MPSSDSAADSTIRFRCNICGAANDQPREAFGRELKTCGACGSSVRTRAIIRMLAREIFGADLSLPDFPVLKGLRGIGMSDSADYTAALAEKFDYRNTEFDREPRLDILNPDPNDLGRYDFIVSSEVLEHVLAPVGAAFTNLFRMLKPSGVLLLTVPYKPEGDTEEHFGPMKEFGLARVGEQNVLVKRRDDGTYEVRDELVFHGGPGSTLEMRVFSAAGLTEEIRRAGFSEIEIYADDCAEFGVVHSETWSLPIAARKEPFTLNRDCARSWAKAWIGARREGEHWQKSYADLERYLTEIQHEAQVKLDDLHGELKARTEWALDLQTRLEERTKWALNLDQDVQQHMAVLARLQSDLEDTRIRHEREKAELEASFRNSRWWRLGKKLGIVP